MTFCPHCGEKALGWHSDFTCEEVFMCSCEQGIVSLWSCFNCEADVQIRVYCIGEAI
jgi:hypothetical protein